MENNTDKISTDWIIYVLVWFFLWSFWIHRFVAWKIWSWVWMLALFVFWWILAIVLVGFLLLWALWIWWVVDGIMIFMWKFEDKDWNKILIKKTISN